MATSSRTRAFSFSSILRYCSPRTIATTPGTSGRGGAIEPRTLGTQEGRHQREAPTLEALERKLLDQGPARKSRNLHRLLDPDLPRWLDAPALEAHAGAGGGAPGLGGDA